MDIQADLGTLLIATTRRACGIQLNKMGVTGHAQECLVGETGYARHERRVEAATIAAKVYSRCTPGGDEADAETQMVATCAILYLDIAGVGGRRGVEGTSTLRHPAFAELGKGRKHASDGNAWSAAIKDALCRASEGRRVCFCIDYGTLVFILGERRIPIDTRISPAAWRMTIAREGLRRALGLVAWRPDLPVVAPRESLPFWGALVNAIHAEAKS